jgi:hypothetical protein
VALPAASNGQTMRVKFSKRLQQLVVTFPGATPMVLCELETRSSHVLNPTQLFLDTK